MIKKKGHRDEYAQRGGKNTNPTWLFVTFLYKNTWSVKIITYTLYSGTGF
jgi:hypothetical protein